MKPRLSQDTVFLRQYNASVRASRVTRNCLRCGDPFKTSEAFRMCATCRNCDATGGLDTPVTYEQVIGQMNA
jgi:hypothetical protein